MSSKDYHIAVADMLSQLMGATAPRSESATTLRLVASGFVAIAAADNPLFDRERFYAAAGMRN